MKTDKPAFPWSGKEVRTAKGFNVPDVELELDVSYPGLTRRELFSAMAMQGLVSQEGKNFAACDVADRAVQYADALIAELDKEQEL